MSGIQGMQEHGPEPWLPHCMTLEGTPGVLQHDSTATVNLRHMVASAAFFPGHAL